MRAQYTPSYDTTITTTTKVVQHNTWHLGHIDWEFPFLDDWRGNKSMLGTDEEQKHWVEQAISRLKFIEANRETTEVWNGVSWRKVLEVGMASAWPYWAPRPTILVDGALGAEWRDWLFVSTTHVRANGVEL